MNTYEIDQKQYPIIGWTESKAAGGRVPLLGIRMMSDERWRELAAEQKKGAEA